VSFLTLAALAVGLFVALPVAAHLLRRRHAEVRPFPPTALLAATPPMARRRSRIEDRALLGVRALAVLGLAVLGATPFVSCSHLALERQGGASVALAIVIDDSLSMRAPLEPGSSASRFERARRGALDLVDDARPGDAFAVVLAGHAPRVALAPTTDRAAARDAIDRLEPADRATDLEAAVALARDLVAQLPQPDRRIVLLSDLRDGHPDAPALAGDERVALWLPLPGLAGPVRGDCALLGASRAAARADVRVACAAGSEGGSPSEGRAIVVRRAGGGDEVARLPLPPTVDVASYGIDLPPVPDGVALVATLDGEDAIAHDDVAPLAPPGAELAIGVVSDATVTRTETGGPPPVEQGLAALGLGASVKPLATAPDDDGELEPLGALVVDDPPGFTPEQRRALGSWIEAGGTLLVALGPTSQAAPLGSSFAGLVPGVVRWGPTPVHGVDPQQAAFFGVTAHGLLDFAPKGRAALPADAAAGVEVLARWKDGAPLLVRRRLGRGSVLALGVPMATSVSDFALRPAFLALLDRVAELARAATGTARVEAGQSIPLEGYERMRAEVLAVDGGAPRPAPIRGEGALARLEPDVRGVYRLELDGETSTRVVTIPAREIDLRAHPVTEGASAGALGGEAPRTDASPYVAVALLALFAIETALRVLSGRRRDEEPEPAAS
jgi:hypothetical protein